MESEKTDLVYPNTEIERQNVKGTALLPIKRKPLTSEKRQLDIFKNVNKTTVVTAETPISQQGGFHCSSCNVILHDSHSYLDHINGKKHQKLLGMNMRVARSTLSGVKRKLSELAKRSKKTETKGKDDIVSRMEKAKREEEVRKMRKKERRKRKAQKISSD